MNHVHILTLPPHTSQKTQPLDRTVFGPVKSSFHGLLQSWVRGHPGEPATIYCLASIIGPALMTGATPRNIQRGFEAAGIWPLNCEVFSDVDFLPAEVTDRPDPTVTGVPENAQPTSSADPVPTNATDVPENAQNTLSTPVPISSTLTLRMNNNLPYLTNCRPLLQLQSLRNHCLVHLHLTTHLLFH